MFTPEIHFRGNSPICFRFLNAFLINFSLSAVFKILYFHSWGLNQKLNRTKDLFWSLYINYQVIFLKNCTRLKKLRLRKFNFYIARRVPGSWHSFLSEPITNLKSTSDLRFKECLLCEHYKPFNKFYGRIC